MARLVIVAVGLLTFTLVYVALQVEQHTQLTPGPLAPAAAVTPRTADSIAGRIDPGQVVVALPLSGAEALVSDLQSGARLNVLASLAEPDSGRLLTAVVARGATVLRPVASGEPLLVEVDPTAALVLAHLVLGGRQLSYAVWPADSAPADGAPMDERTARALLGLPARANPTLEPTARARPTATAMPVPTATPPPRTSGPAADRYVAQPGDTLASVADQLGVDLGRLAAANPEVPNSGPLAPGMQLVVPQYVTE